MKTNNPPIRAIVYIILVLIALITGVKFGALLYNYEKAVNGILGVANLYFIYSLFRSRDLHATKLLDPNIEFPRDLKYILVTVLLYLIIYWSTRQMIGAIYYIRDLLVLRS